MTAAPLAPEAEGASTVKRRKTRASAKNKRASVRATAPEAEFGLGFGLETVLGMLASLTNQYYFTKRVGSPKISALSAKARNGL
jgi:hypothetical protein